MLDNLLDTDTQLWSHSKQVRCIEQSEEGENLGVGKVDLAPDEQLEEHKCLVDTHKKLAVLGMKLKEVEKQQIERDACCQHNVGVVPLALAVKQLDRTMLSVSQLA